MNSDSAISVSRLVALLRDVVEENFLTVSVEGEISNFSTPASGHFYFTLKESDAQLRTVMFRVHNRLLRFLPENGLKVICHGRVSVYSQRGELQFIAEGMVPSGLGGLQLAFEQLRDRLQAEGLFSQEIKKSVPPYPETIGIVTSATGAALQDILQILRRRGVAARILLSPVRVQGDGAAAEIAQAIKDQNRWGKADVLIIGRGGGSLEDLWPFNEEVVARAIRASKIPVISAVGHETDSTISDFAADLRAPTPSAAAELVSRGQVEREVHLDHLTARLESLMEIRIKSANMQLAGLSRRLRSPLENVDQQRRLLLQLDSRLDTAIKTHLHLQRAKMAGLFTRLELLSPLATVARGYAIVTKESREVVRRPGQVTPGEKIYLRLQQGRISAVVDSCEEQKDELCGTCSLVQ